VGQLLTAARLPNTVQTLVVQAVRLEDGVTACFLQFKAVCCLQHAPGDGVKL
jgi:hypothetical protein